jgi:hypothetical protein
LDGLAAHQPAGVNGKAAAYKVIEPRRYAPRRDGTSVFPIK